MRPDINIIRDNSPPKLKYFGTLTSQGKTMYGRKSQFFLHAMKGGDVSFI